MFLLTDKRLVVSHAPPTQPLSLYCSMSTAWFKQNFKPKLIESFSKTSKDFHGRKHKKCVEIWHTTCVVKNFGKTRFSRCNVLINPTSPSLLGVKKFSYFPKGGPQPSHPPTKKEHHIMGYVRSWGSIDTHDGMIFPFNVVDGLVHELGGWKLDLSCFLVSKNENGERCSVGEARLTRPGGDKLAREYDYIVHTVPPFFDHYEGDPMDALYLSYKNSIELSKKCADENNLRLATVLIGAGCRGFPIDNAIEAATKVSTNFLQNDDIHVKNGTTLAFAITQMNVAEKLVCSIKEEINK